MARNHTYEQLPSEPSIRLLKVLDPSPDGNVNCVLTIHGIREVPSYRALSYTWGPPSDLASEGGVTADRSYPISCNGGNLMVTKNLLDALSYMQRTRLITSEDYIWIDAICISQDDEDEKSSQVYMMFDIYSAAQSVVVWLGEEDEDTSLALEILPSVAAIPDDRIGRFDNLDLDFMDPIFEEYISPHSPTHWRALTMLMRKHWFNRVWIIQEFLAAKEVLILCGSFTISWELLVKASRFFATSSLSRFVLMNLMNDYPWLESSLFKPISRAYELSMFKSRLNNSIQPLHLMEFLALGSDYGATNPRDKVYALLGVANRNSRAHPDYRLDVETVYVDATRYVINESQDLAILAVVEDTRDEASLDNINSLPSWVPNFNVQTSTAFRKPLVAVNLPPPRIVWQPNPRMIGISGAKLDRIFYIENSSMGPRIEGISQWLRILFFSEPTYLNGEARLEALGRTLIENGVGSATNSEGILILFQLWLAWEVARILVEDRRTGFESDRTRLIYGSLNAIGMFEPPLPFGPLLTSGTVESFVSALNGEPRDEDTRDASRLANRYGELIMSKRRSKAFLTDRGRFGTAPRTSELYDTIWIVPGASDPLLLRPTGDSDHFWLMGYVYLHGFDLDDVLHNERLNWQDIILE
jgi:Heterokaryon incompatibility protein (HET)